MKLFNTLSGIKEEFKSQNDRNVGMYTCGPTVYGVAHIGNLRTYIFSDLLKRILLSLGFEVKQVMNITDIEDKIIKKSEGNKEKFREVVEGYEKKFWEDLSELNIVNPDVVTHVTAYIDKIVEFIEDLIKKGYAYKAADQSIYFSIGKFKEYGKLAKLDKENLKVGARVAQDEYDKENPADFALWKAWDENDGEIFWETSLGKGRPGWHIECSTMAMDVLGDTIDIHTGGVDNIFPHHENEIAQSEARTGKKFVNFWVHGEHLLVDNKKMSKSLQNFYTLDDIKKHSFSALDFRYLVLGAHYRSKLNFTWEGLGAAKNARERLNRIVTGFSGMNDDEVDSYYISKFNERISDDLDLPGALAALWEMMRDEKVVNESKYATALKMDEILGLGLGQEEKIEIPGEIIKLAEERKIARINKDFIKSDELRAKINALGWNIEDLKDNEYLLSRSFKI